MSTENITAFLAKMKTDPSIAEKIALASAEAMVSIAQQEGLSFSVEELITYQVSAIDDADLESVSGGARCGPNSIVGTEKFTEEQKEARRSEVWDDLGNALGKSLGLLHLRRFF